MSALSLVEIEGDALPQRQPLFQIRVIDPPRPKQRARTVHHGRQSYTPKQTQQAAYLVRQALITKYGNPAEGAFEPFAGGVFLRFTAWLKMPETTPKYKRATILPLCKPDLPNMIMLLADALSGYAYRDDKLICRSVELKLYAGTYGGPNYPCWEVEVFEFDPSIDAR